MAPTQGTTQVPRTAWLAREAHGGSRPESAAGPAQPVVAAAPAAWHACCARMPCMVADDERLETFGFGHWHSMGRTSGQSATKKQLRRGHWMGEGRKTSDPRRRPSLTLANSLGPPS